MSMAPSSGWVFPRSGSPTARAGREVRAFRDWAVPSACLPCGSALGATWNPDLAERLGGLIGREALDRGCRGLSLRR